MHKLYRVLSSAHTQPEPTKIIEWLSCMLLLELRLYELVERDLRIIRLLKFAFEYLSLKSVLFSKPRTSSYGVSSIKGAEKVDDGQSIVLGCGWSDTDILVVNAISILNILLFHAQINKFLWCYHWHFT